MNQYQYQANVQLGAGFVIAIALISLAFGVLMIAAMWRVFSKAGQPGWAAIIPIYNTIVLLRVVGRPWWWVLLMLIPFVNIVLLFIVYIDLAKSFGQGTGFGVLTVFFPYICVPILGFGSARYVGPAGGQPPYPGGPYQGGPYQQQYPGQPGQYPAQPGQQPYGQPGQYPGQQYPPPGQYPGQQPGGNPYGAPPQYPGQQYPPQ
ncbi:DUF5684 domain-containing protein [Amycolatopsis acididurans]|uniref:DUF5684 domain-containing protein n=1 Tax=Amycolatopsis acididurans TaxID=2724524 RepID=UPI001B32D420|nr:DUF5684 domain-containing protein [Amycolatopsis acididurans]